jgi:hypothetical protein
VSTQPFSISQGSKFYSDYLLRSRFSYSLQTTTHMLVKVHINWLVNFQVGHILKHIPGVMADPMDAC